VPIKLDPLRADDDHLSLNWSGANNGTVAREKAPAGIPRPASIDRNAVSRCWQYRIRACL